VPLVLLITCSITFGLFPGHFYQVIRAGTDPLVSRITQVTPLTAQNGGDQLEAMSEESQRIKEPSMLITHHSSPITDYRQ